MHLPVKQKQQGHGQELSFTIIQYWKILLGTVFKLNKHAWIWLVIAILLMSVWHIPEVFDYAFTHSQVHVLQHISFIVVGAAIFVTIRILGVIQFISIAVIGWYDGFCWIGICNHGQSNISCLFYNKSP